MALVAKPAGPTSHDVVDIARRALGTRRVGHLGTLDPMAEGLLVLVVGRATRLAPFAAGWSKRYEGTMRLGTATSTDDATGELLTTSDTWQSMDRAQVSAALEGFLGAQEQLPPAHSAVKVGGERAYRRARRGETVALAPRPVEVHSLELVDFAPPDIRFRATVSAGTYVRGLARDIGNALACGAHLAALRRTAVGPFELQDAVAPDAVTPASLRDPAVLVAHLPRHDLTSAEREAAVHGRPIEDREAGHGGMVALFSEGRLVAVAEAVGEALKPRVVVSDA